MTSERKKFIKKFIAKFFQDFITGMTEGVLFILLTFITYYLVIELLSYITSRRFL